MENNKAIQQRVTQANRHFYDAVAHSYEEIDGRRTPGLEHWLKANLQHIRSQCSGDTLLDIGAGSGLVTRCAQGLFKNRVGVDISARILNVHRRFFDFGAAADVNQLPFASQRFDAVTCFAVLHHLYSFEGLVAEVKRVLKPGGIFYSDHDMDASFSERFNMPLSLYRKLYNPKARYGKVSRTITPELYTLTEWQERGVNFAYLVSLFEKEGFSVKHHFHWYGLTFLTDLVFQKKHYSRGWAPLCSIIAVKNS